MSDFVDPDLTINASGQRSAPQLGVLCLAAALLEKEFSPHIVNLDDLFVEFLSGRPTQRTVDDYFVFVVRHLESLSFDILGFSTISSSYPLTLRLAKETKRLHPDAQIILGGPQKYRSVDEITVMTFPFIDVIVRGEADSTFPLLLNVLRDRDSSVTLENVQGITFRQGSRVIRTPNAPVISDLDSLPLPAFHLDPHIKDRGGLHL